MLSKKIFLRNQWVNPKMFYTQWHLKPWAYYCLCCQHMMYASAMRCLLVRHISLGQNHWSGKYPLWAIPWKRRLSDWKLFHKPPAVLFCLDTTQEKNKIIRDDNKMACARSYTSYRDMIALYAFYGLISTILSPSAEFFNHPSVWPKGESVNSCGQTFHWNKINK